MKILKIHSLNKGWVDRDFLMLHACFQILSDCVELEKVDEFANYETHKDSIDEIRFLYNWWQKRKNSNDFEDEDNEMLLRLMKVREFLWT